MKIKKINKRIDLIHMIENNEDLTNIEVSRITNISNLFSNKKFNQDISNWYIQNKANVYNMFFKALNFNKNLYKLSFKNLKYREGFYNRDKGFIFIKNNL